MEKNLSILLVEDDPITCQNFAKHIDETEDFSIVGVTNNATKALDYIKNTLPDVIILDLELHQGGGNGLSLLQSMQQTSLSKLPYVLVTTNNSSAITYESARQLGADFIMAKHQEDYSEKAVLDFLQMIKSSILSNQKVVSVNQQENESPADYTKRITRRIMVEINKVGLNPSAVGYQYLIDAIILNIQEPTHNLCSIIAKKYSKSEGSVQRAMQNAIEKAWRTADIDDLITNYTAIIHSNKGVPTITEFVCYYANKLKNEP